MGAAGANRITAATALTHGLKLVNLNGRDFRDVLGLQSEEVGEAEHTEVKLEEVA